MYCGKEEREGLAEIAGRAETCAFSRGAGRVSASFASVSRGSEWKQGDSRRRREGPTASRRKWRRETVVIMANLGLPWPSLARCSGGSTAKVYQARSWCRR